LGLPTIRKVLGRFEEEFVIAQSKSLRLETVGPWPIVFAGYVLHAMNNWPMSYNQKSWIACG